MKNIFNLRTTSVDTKAIQATIERALIAAGLDTTSGLMRQTTRTIRQALRVAEQEADNSVVMPFETLPAAKQVGVGVDGDSVVVPPAIAVGDALKPAGTFQRHEFVSAMGRLSYKLYVPPAPTDMPLPIVVMLHGCTQSADDFAAGTQMNRLAQAHGFLVVYPEQGTHANPSKCWNWFNPQDQMRERGEPSLLAGVVQQVIQLHSADPRRIFVAGLSAGAAMALVLSETYPELIAGVGVHSGLPYGSASDVVSAMSVMKGGKSRIGGLKEMMGSKLQPCRTALQAVPIIIFHGDRDHTVQHSNGVTIAQQAREAHEAIRDCKALPAHTTQGKATGGRGFSRTVYADDTGLLPIELWTVHGAGHAWSGGDASGSYTDPAGPDASAQMVRFFLSLPLSPSS